MKSLTLLFLCFSFTVFSQPKAKLVKAEYIFAVSPTPACHASTIVELSKNTFMASWFGGKYESSPDVGIWIATNEKGKWSEAKQIANGIINDTLRYPCWNPVLFKTKAGKLLLFYKVGKNPREWWGMKMTSEDNGKHWSKAEKLPDGILGPIKNKPFQLVSGEILYPSSTESLDEKVWNIHLEKSDKNAKTFKKINIACDTFGVIQPSILQYSGNKLQLLCRSRQNAVVQTWSNDNGNTWSPLTLTNLPNPNSGTDATTLKNGLQVLVYNPLKKGADWFNGRYKLNVAVSKNGKDWQDVYTLEDEKEGEFSYPAIIQSTDGLVHITYTANRKNIKHIVLKINQ
eukprot:GILI01029913.1.p1 GENE.GILI01029913.1~~GILI01029913.1.p1  ORF type:complete len:343 (+),score=-36.65 GILI01029913.1:226-1254(+)